MSLFSGIPSCSCISFSFSEASMLKWKKLTMSLQLFLSWWIFVSALIASETTRFRVCAKQGTCVQPVCLTAATMLVALSVTIATTFRETPHSSATFGNDAAMCSAVWSFFNPNIARTRNLSSHVEVTKWQVIAMITVLDVHRSLVTATWEICRSSRFISPARVVYISGSKLLIMCLLEDSWYQESSKHTSDWNPVSSTMVAGCMLIAIILIRAWSMFLLRAQVGEYFCQVCVISDMVCCCRLSVVLCLLDAFSSSSFLWFSASLCWAGCFNFKCYKRKYE